MLRVHATVALFLAVLVAAPVSAQTVRYVDDDAPLGGDGTTWPTAYRHLQDALAEAGVSGEITAIRVADGHYRPDLDESGNVVPGDRRATFQLLNNVVIYGAYAGIGASDPDLRDLVNSVSILSGDLNGDDDADFSSNGENSYHVVFATNTDASAVLDGLTLMGGNADGEAGDDGDGGGMFGSNGSPTLSNCVIRENHAVYGGGMMIWRGSPNLTNCVFSDNETSFSGSAMYNILDSSPTLTNCAFTGNSNADSSGGAMINQANSNPVMTDCTFTGNFSGSGGAVCNAVGASPTFTRCVFANNSATGAGGAIYNYLNCNPLIQNCRFIGNVSTASSGGGIINWESKPVIVDCEFDENSASSGGAIYNYLVGSDSSVVNSVFRGNSAYSGGAVYNNADTAPTLTNCVFSGNYADGYGGGFYSTGATATLTNCTLSGNSAYWYGGGMYNSYDSILTLANCILWGNADYEGNGESAQIRGGDIAMSYTCVQDADPDDEYVPFGGEDNQNIDDDPMFINSNGPDGVAGTTDDDVRLLAESPGIDAGTNGADTDANTSGVQPLPGTDLAGNARLADGDGDDIATVDMGAYERQTGEEMSADLALDHTWMYQSLLGQDNSRLTAAVVNVVDPLANASYTYAWEFELAADVAEPPTTVWGGGATDAVWEFAAPSCGDGGPSDAGMAHVVRVTITGADHGNSVTVQAEFGIGLLGDVNNDTTVNSADRAIANTFWRTGAAGDFAQRDCDANCDGVVNSADRAIINAVWRGTLCSNSVSEPCPVRGALPARMGALSGRMEKDRTRGRVLRSAFERTGLVDVDGPKRIR